MRSYRAGETVEDICRACKIDRLHTIIAVDGTGHPIRVQCDYCGSQHNFRGGARDSGGTVAHAAPQAERPRTTPSAPFPPVGERERVAEPQHVTPASSDPVDLEMLLRRVIREESGLTPAVPADRWRGGTMALRPGNPALQEKTWPIETLFHKVVMIRNRLRTLEQQVNTMDIPEDAKIKLQGYITGCYGSLTSFNILFADDADQFRGAASD